MLVLRWLVNHKLMSNPDRVFFPQLGSFERFLCYSKSGARLYLHIRENNLLLATTDPLHYLWPECVPFCHHSALQLKKETSHITEFVAI